MNIPEKHLKTLEKLGKSRIGEDLIEYLLFLKSELSNLALLDEKSFPSRKDALNLMDIHIVQHLQSYKDKKTQNKEVNQYQ